MLFRSGKDYSSEKIPSSFTFACERARNEVIDYPLVSMSAIKDKDKISMAFSGLGDYPFRSYESEDILNSDGLPKETKLQKAVDIIKDRIESDMSGSKEYKEFMLYNVLDTALEDF